MSAMPLALLLATAAITTAVGVAVLRTLLGLRRQITALHAELAAQHLAVGAHGLVPQARASSDAAAIRAAVAEALAEERERELAEARAFWAAQEARDAADAPSLLGLPDSELFLPRQSDFVGLEPLEPAAEPGTDVDEFVGESPELAAARRRHPSHPDFVPAQSPGRERPRTHGRPPGGARRVPHGPGGRPPRSRSAPSTSTSSRTVRRSA